MRDDIARLHELQRKIQTAGQESLVCQHSKQVLLVPVRERSTDNWCELSYAIQKCRRAKVQFSDTYANVQIHDFRGRLQTKLSEDEVNDYLQNVGIGDQEVYDEVVERETSSLESEILSDRDYHNRHRSLRYARIVQVVSLGLSAVYCILTLYMRANYYGGEILQGPLLQQFEMSGGMEYQFLKGNGTALTRYCEDKNPSYVFSCMENANVLQGIYSHCAHGGSLQLFFSSVSEVLSMHIELWVLYRTLGRRFSAGVMNNFTYEASPTHLSMAPIYQETGLSRFVSYLLFFKAISKYGANKVAKLFYGLCAIAILLFSFYLQHVRNLSLAMVEGADIFSRHVFEGYMHNCLEDSSGGVFGERVDKCKASFEYGGATMPNSYTTAVYNNMRPFYYGPSIDHPWFSIRISYSAELFCLVLFLAASLMRAQAYVEKVSINAFQKAATVLQDIMVGPTPYQSTMSELEKHGASIE